MRDYPTLHLGKIIIKEQFVGVANKHGRQSNILQY